jgi:hypothetical protein
MVAQRPPKPRQLDPSAAAQARPTSDVGHESNRAGGMDLASAAPPANVLSTRLEHEAGKRARPVAGSAPGDMFETRDAVWTRSVERVFVVDGADRMVYGEIRDRKGWRQPLAAHEALSEARRIGVGDGDHAREGTRIVQTSEGAQERQAATSRLGGPPTPTAYAIGKATVLANNSGRVSQSQSLGVCRAFPPTPSGRRLGQWRQFKQTSTA